MDEDEVEAKVEEEGQAKVSPAVRLQRSLTITIKRSLIGTSNAIIATSLDTFKLIVGISKSSKAMLWKKSKNKQIL